MAGPTLKPWPWATMVSMFTSDFAAGAAGAAAEAAAPPGAAGAAGAGESLQAPSAAAATRTRAVQGFISSLLRSFSVSGPARPGQGFLEPGALGRLFLE